MIAVLTKLGGARWTSRALRGCEGPRGRTTCFGHGLRALYPGFSFQSYWFDFLGEIENFGQNIDIQIAYNNVNSENSLNLSCGMEINNAHSFQFVNDADTPSI